jgi:hypothetical protein
MQVETVGNYQIHLIAHELPPPGGWDPFVEIYQFDEEKQDFRCVLEKRRVSERALPSYEAAIEAARHFGNGMVQNKKI